MVYYHFGRNGTMTCRGSTFGVGGPDIKTSLDLQFQDLHQAAKRRALFPGSKTLQGPKHEGVDIEVWKNYCDIRNLFQRRMTYLRFMIVDYSQEPPSDVLWFVVSNSTIVSRLCFLLLELQVT